MHISSSSNSKWPAGLALLVVGVLLAVGLSIWLKANHPSPGGQQAIVYKPRMQMLSGGFDEAMSLAASRKDPTDLEETAQAFTDIGHRNIKKIDAQLAHEKPEHQIRSLILKCQLYAYEGEPREAYRSLQEARQLAEASPELAAEILYTLIYLQGVVSLRLGEDENCLLCRGEGACMLPIVPTAVHTMPEGSRRAVKHFSEYLQQFPEDYEVRWVLNIAHMTLGEHPQKVDTKHLIPLDRYATSEHGIGAFQDIAHLIGLKDRLNHAGGAIMEDFDNDGFLDIIVTSKDPTTPMCFFRNKGDGSFEDCTAKAGLAKQFGGINCSQGDFNNDGHMDLIIVRGAWLKHPMRISLLKNNGNGTFSDVTREAGLWGPINSHSATWIDFDNDGLLDIYVCTDHTANRLYRNTGDGTFEDVAASAGVRGRGKYCKGATWIDIDNDGHPDLFLSYLNATPQLFRNNANGSLNEVTESMGIAGPDVGFSSWAFDFDNDGFLDIYVNGFNHKLEEIVKGMLDQPHTKRSVGRLYRNIGGKKFQDVTSQMGLDNEFSAMGSNFADFDNDGFLDFYLGTGDPDLTTLVPNRLFRNLGGKRFVDISASSRTGHLQKGHGVACGDLHRDGAIDMFVELGGATPGDRFRNALFVNPSRAKKPAERHSWLTLKLRGAGVTGGTNKGASGARIKVLTDGAEPLTLHRHVTSGSTFGGNPLQQTLGLGRAGKVALLEIHWPTSKTTQVFRDVPVNQAIEITEFAKDYRKLDWTPVPLPKDVTAVP